MEYRRQVQPPGTRHEVDTDDENHSVFDFPPSFTPPDRLGRTGRSDKNNMERAQAAARHGKSRNANFPYPSSISIQKSATSSEKRSPTASPSEREHRRGESRQENSPYRPKNHYDAASSEIKQHHTAGQTFFLRNRLSEAVDEYSHAIRAGLDELKHRKEMISRLGNGRNRDIDGRNDQDSILIDLGEAIANVHFDMAHALEVCGKYSDAKEEFSNGIGLLQNTCHKRNSDEMLKRAFKNVSRMESGMDVEGQRIGLQEDLESAMRKIENAATMNAKEAARLNAMGCIKRLLRMEREAMGEQCYAVAKLKLKLAKLKCECGELDNGLDDAESAIKTLKSVLGSRHALVGASCSFAASAYEKRVSVISGVATTCAKSIEGLSADGKVMINRALELYADTLEPMQFKYNEEDSLVRPDVGEVFHKIGRLYAKKGNHASALDAYHRSLESLGPSHQGFHSDAAIVWHDLAQLHLASKDYQDAIDAAGKSTEMANKSSRSQKDSDRIGTLAVWNLQIAGDAYSSANRYEEATRSYQDALVELKRSQPNSNSSRTFAFGPLDESRLLKRIGMTFLKQGKIDDAKVSLIDALRVMRLDRDSERSPDLPALMADIGALHIKTHDNDAALAVLRPCLKLYADQGVSDYSPEVQKANDLFKRAQAQSSGRLEFSQRSSQERLEPSPSRNITAATPRTQVTAVTIPSTNPSSSQSNISPRQLEVAFSPDYSPAQHGREKELAKQLDEVKSELARAKEAHRSELSRLNDSHQVEISRLKENYASNIRDKELSLSSELDCAKREIARLKEEHNNEATKLRQAHAMGSEHNDEVKSLSIQLDKKITELAQVKEAQSRDAVLLQEAEDKLKQARHRLKEVEAERDQEKKERVQAAISIRSEVDIAVAKAKSEMVVQIETLKKELSVSESSYQQILRAIDEEKEELGKSHDTKIRELTAENSQLRTELEGQVESREREYTEQNKKIMQENGLLKYFNRNLRGDKEALASEIAALKKKLDAKSTEKSNEAVIAEKLRKAELELESEKRRRAILESELDNDSRLVPMQPMPGYPMFSQFGYPPMMSYNTDRSSDKKSRLLEVDLAAERENKEALEKTVSELTAALEQEKHALKTQRESLIATHEREMNEVFTELKKKEDDVAELSDIAKEFHSVAEELSQTKLQLDEKSKLADAYEKTRDDLLGEKSTSAALSSNLANVQDSLDQKVKEYNELIDQHERMKKLHEEVASYYEYEIQQLKVSNKESNELLEAKIATIEEMKSANRRLEEEMSEASAVHRAHIARLEQELAEVSDNMKSEMDNLARLKSKELFESKSQLKNALQELQSVYSAKEAAEQEARDLKIAVEEKNEEFIEVLANNEALCVDVEGLRSMSENSDRELNEAKDKIKSLTVENSNLEIEMDRMKAQLSDIKQENTMYGEQFADLERVLDQMDSKLVNAETTLQEREAALKVAEDRLASNQRDIDAREKDAELIYDKYTELETSFHRILSSVIHKFDSLLPQSETSESSLESLEEKKIHITALATLVSNQMKEKDRQIQEVNFDMSNALRELDTLESKYKQTRADLAASMDACKDEQQLENDYDELMRYCADLENTIAENRDLGEQIRKLQIERKLQQEEISGLKEAIEQHVEALKVAEEQRDVFQSRLKEAVDDLEELESERNELRSDLDKTYTESASLERSLRVKIDCLEEENNRLMQLDGQNVQRDAEAWDKDNKIKELQKKLEIANNALDILRPAQPTSSPECSGKRRSYSLNGDEMYPDLLPSNVDVCDELASLRSVIKALESQNMKLSERLADLQGGSPKMIEQVVQTLESSMDVPPPPPLPVHNAAVQTIESSTDMDDVLSLKARLSELIDQNDELTRQIDELKQEAETKKADEDAEKSKLLNEIGSLTTKVQHLQEINGDLSLKVHESQAELVKAAERDGEKLGSLQKEVDNLKQQNRTLKHDLNEVSSRSQYSSVDDTKDKSSSEKEEMLQEITSLRDHIQTLEEYNEELSSQLVELQEAVADITSREQDAIAEEIQALQRQVEALETSNKELSIKLEESRAETSNEYQQEIASLRKALDEKNDHIHDNCKRELDNQKQQHQAELEALKSQLYQSQKDLSHDECKRTLEDHKEKHQAEVRNLKSQIYHLQDSNNAHQEDISLLQIDLQNALNDCDENEIRHQQELSTVNMEFTNALNSLEYLQKENKRLKLDIQSLSDMSKMSHHGGESSDTDDAVYFEKEISAAHARFVSMEKSLQDRIERLEGEKYKLMMAHKDEMEKKDIAFEKVRVELSAWKLEMQNALNDIEGIKRERNELEQQIAVYKASLDALSSANEEGQLDNFVGGN